MIKNYFRIFLVLTTLCLNPAICKAEDEITNYDFKQLYYDPVSKNLRETFDYYINNKVSDSENISDKQREIFKEKFIVLKIDQYKEDHYLINILINPDNIEAWSVEIRKTRAGYYKILHINEVVIKNLKSFKKYVTKEEFGYWQ